MELGESFSSSICLKPINVNFCNLLNLLNYFVIINVKFTKFMNTNKLLIHCYTLNLIVIECVSQLSLTSSNKLNFHLLGRHSWYQNKLIKRIRMGSLILFNVFGLTHFINNSCIEFINSAAFNIIYNWLTSLQRSSRNLRSVLIFIPHVLSREFSWPIFLSLITSHVLLTAIKFLALLGFERQVLRREAQKHMSWQK